MFAVLIILVMVFLILGRVLVSYVEDSTAEAVAQLSEVLGVPVSVNSVDTEWHGLGPNLVLNGVSLGEGDDLSTLTTLAVKPDVLSSLRNLTLVWSRFEVSGLDLDVEELASGHWQVAGIGFEGRSGARVFLEKMLLDSRLVSVSDAQVHLTSLSGTTVDLRLHDLRLVNVLGFHRLRLDADFGSQKNRLNFIAELNGAALQFADLDGLAHLQITGEDATGLFYYIQDKFWPESRLELTSTPVMQAEFWATFRAGQEVQMQGDLRFDQLPGAIVGLDSGVAQAHASVVGVYSDERLQADLIDPRIQTDENELVLPNLRLSRKISEQMVTYGLQLPSVDVGRLIESAGEVGIVPESLLYQLSGLELQGLVERLYLEVPADNPQGWKMTADLLSFGMNSFNQAPAVRNLTGRLGLDHFGGRLDVDATEFSILYPQVYDHWLAHDAIRGLVAWEIDTENRFVHVFSDHIEAESAQGSVIGAFAADIPMFPDYPTGVGLTLYLGLTDSGVEHTSSLLPARLPQNLQNWLNQSLVSGTVPQAGMIYRGSTRPGTEEYRTVQLHIKAENTELNFLPRWPNLMDANADIWVSNTELYARSTSASVLGLDLGVIDVWVDAPVSLQNNAHSTTRQIRISGQAQGPANNVLDLIRKTNLRDRIGSGLDDLDLQGEVDSTIDLAMPLATDVQRQDMQLNVDVSLSGNQLNMADLNLSLSGINGLLRYGNSGLTSENLSANVWGSALSLRISEDIDDAVVRIEGEGELGARSIADWLGFGLLEGIQGTASVTGDLEINTDIAADKAHVFEFWSDMTDVDSGLPEPLAKPSGLPAPINVRLEKTGHLLTRVDWQLPFAEEQEKANLFQLQTVSDADLGGIQSAIFAYGADLPESEAEITRGSIRLSSLELDPWLALFEAYVPMADSDDGRLLGLKPELDFEVDNLSIGNANFGHVTGNLGYQDDAWSIDLETDYASGAYRHYRDQDTLPLLSLSRLDINAYLEFLVSRSEQEDSEKVDVIGPGDLPEMQFELQSVVYDETERGHWKGEFRPTETGLWIDNLEGGLGSAVLTQGEGESSVFWGIDSYGQYTEANITFEYGDIGDLFRILDMNPPLNSSSGLLFASLHWQGAPFEFSGSDLNGVMGFDATDGEFFTRGNNANPLIKTIGLFNAEAWTRRLRLDFKDVTAEGTYYDRVFGDFVLEEGLVTTLTPVTVNMSSGSMQFDGEVDLDLELVDARLVMTLPARQNMTWVTALIGGLPAAAGVWLASMIFDEELDNLSSVSYRVNGSMDDLEVKAERIFDSTISD